MLGPRNATLVLLTATAMALGAAGPASAADVPQGPTPLAFAQSSGCPSADQVSGRELQAAATGALRRLGSSGAEGAFTTWMLTTETSGNPVTAVSICDPAAAATGRPLGPLGGARLGDPGRDAVAPGARALVGQAWTAGAALRVGDRVTFPATAAGAIVDVRVQTGRASTPVRLGPLAGPPQSLEVTGSEAAPVVRVTLGDGTATEVAVPPATLTAPTLAVRARRDRLTFTGRVQPGALVVADHPRTGNEDEFLPVPDGGSSAGADGRFHLRTNRLARGLRTVTLDATELSTSAASGWSCRLAWRRDRIRHAQCRPRPVTASAPSALPTLPGFAARPALPQPAARQASRAQAAAAAARRTATADATVTTIGRLGYEADPELSDDLLATDLNGDARPEVLSNGYAGEHTLLMSGPTGWRAARLVESPLAALTLIPDLTGDGLGELWTDAAQAFTGSTAWAGGATPTIDLRPASGPGPGGFALPATEADLGPAPPQPLPDATGDGRPELLVGATIYASESVPLGRSTTLPGAWTPIGADDFAAFERALEADHGSDSTDPSLAAADAGGDAQQYASGAAEPLFVQSVTTGRAGAETSEVHLSTLSPATGWAEHPTGMLRVPGRVAILAGDPLGGEAVLSASSCRRARCLIRYVRVDRGGRVLGTAMQRAEFSEGTAYFVADGADQDARAEVVLRTGTNRSAPLQLWSSASANAKVASLPALAEGRTAIRPHGPVSAWLRGAAPGGLVVLGRPDRKGAVPVMLVEPR